MNVPENNEPPPPPYSETDLFSNPGSGDQSSGGRTPATSQATPSVAGESTVSRPPASISSSQSDVVFTPPLTPRIANSHDSFLPPSSSAQAAQAYFESRPVPASLFPGPILNHAVVVTPSSRPDDFPYPQAWAGRDVVPADWQTFLNFLLPAHTATSNGEVFSRKLRAEEESIAAATPGSSTSGRSHVSAQLEHLRNSHNDALTPTAEVKQEATSVTAEWNQGFFQARSLHVHLVYDLAAQLADGQRAQMPGAWDSGSDPNTPQHPHQGPYQPPPHPPPGMGHPLPWGPGNQHPPKSEFNFAGIRMNDDGLYIGNSVAADRNGLRLGGLVADTNGLRYRDNVVVGPGMFSGGPSNEYPGAMYHAKGYPPPVNPPAGYSPQPGTSPGAFPPTQNPFHDPSAARPALNRGPSDPYSYPQPPAPPRRPRSGSSGSSDSGSSSSTSSLGSLPDYDELNEAQIPVYRSTLQNWLITPEKQVTKQDVIRLKAELREAKRRHVEYPQGSIDKKALKAEIKALRQEWRTLKRAQRSLRREARRQRRTQRRLEKKERRNSRHAQKQAERNHRHARGPGSWGSPSIPPPGMGMPPTGPPQPGSGSIGGPPPTVPPFGYAPGFGRGFGRGFGCGSRGGFGRGPGGGFGGGPGCGFGGGPGVGFGGGPGVGFGGGPGGGFGRSLGPMHPPMPGAWGPDEFPGDSKGQSQGVGTGQGSPQWEEPWPREAVPAREPHVASQAKFKQLDELEKELARKMDQMFETRTENVKKEEKVDENEKQSADVSTAEVTAEVHKLEVEVDALTRQVERLRMEADETFARELDEEDRRQAGMRV